MRTVRNSFTVDVEDWFHVSAFRARIPREDWPRCQYRVERNMDRLLELMDRAQVRATCFVLGWVAERSASLVRRILCAGHEVASHGCEHELVRDLTPEQFKERLRRAVDSLRQGTGAPVLGYRAASFSLPRGERRWAYEIMAGEGLRYDSSIFPIRRRFYGHPDAPWSPYDVPVVGGTIREFPLPVWSAAGMAVPFGGGGYFRLYPYALTAAMFRGANAAGRPVTFYVHPWEIDSDQPVPPVGMVTRLRHYNNIGRVEGRLRRLWSEFRFVPLAERLDDGP